MDIFVLNDSSKYYQKLGEVWDHETKDFKVLYKPLYCCPSKKGSYEAHHLATSTFERWQRKFSRVDSVNPKPEEINKHLVALSSVEDLSAGHDTLPLLSCPLPAAVWKGSAKVTTVVEDLVTPVISSQNSMCRSESGFGSRSLVPHHVVDFAPEFQKLISEGHKRATTRVLAFGVENGEPDLMRLVSALKGEPENGVEVQAISGSQMAGPAEVFASLRVTAVQPMLFSELTPEIAAIELFPSLDSLKKCLEFFYPWIQDDSEVHVFYFEVI